MTDKEIFDAIRARRGSPLTNEHVTAINAIMYPPAGIPVGGLAIGSRGFDRRAGIERIAVPTVELRLIHRQLAFGAADHLRPCRLAWRRVWLCRWGGCPGSAKCQQA